MNLAEMKTKYQSILDAAKTANRSLSAVETESLDGLKAEITAIEKTASDGIKETEKRSTAAAASFQPGNLSSSDYFRSLTKGAADVGNVEVINDVVRVYNETSPLFAAHRNVQPRSTGNAFSFTVVNPGNGAGYAKTEGDAGTDDTDTTLTMSTVAFVTYSGQKILCSQEMLDDAAANVSQEVTTLGLAKSVAAWEADAVAELETPFLSGSSIASTFLTNGTTFAASDIVNVYFEIPVRNRQSDNIKYMCNSKTAKSLVGLMTNVVEPQFAYIHFDADHILEVSAMPDNVLIVGDPTLALAVARKEPIRTLVLQVSEGATFEVQPRLAVALRDASALACRKLHP